MAALYLTEKDVAALANITDAIRVLEDVFRQWPEIGGENVARKRTKLPTGMFNLLGAGYSPGGVYGVKSYLASPAGARFQVALYSAQSGEMLALIEADGLSRMRTGAASGVATRILARTGARVAGVIGTGQQALTQVQALCAVRKIEEIRVFSRSEANRRRFADLVMESLGVQAMAVADAEECVRGADIVTTITKSPSPVCLGEWIKPGAHINAAGANAANRSELDAAAVLKSHIRSTDSREQARQEAGEYLSLVQSAEIDWAGIAELGDIACGQHPGRTEPSQITLFKSLGIGVEDVAFAEWVYREAVRKGAGTRLPF